MLRNQFALLREEAGSPMSSVMSVTDPTDLDASMEIAKPDEGWMDLQSWTLPPDVQSLDVRRSEFDRCESTLFKAESDLGFDVAWQPCAQQMSCGPLLILLKRARVTPSPMRGDGYRLFRSLTN